MATKIPIATSATCPAGTFSDPEHPNRCIPFTVLTGKTLTIVQGPECWPKSFTIRTPFSPAIQALLSRAIEEELRRTSPPQLLRKLKAAPRLHKRVRNARARRARPRHK